MRRHHRKVTMTIERPLGCLPASDNNHVDTYPLTAGTMPTSPTPVTIGINWYSGFDAPVKKSDGTYWIPTSNWGRVRGGHAVCLKPPSLIDNLSWWKKYDQQKEGACVGFAVCRMMSLMNRTFYSGLTHYKHAQRIDEWGGEDYSGTSVRAGCDVARLYGMYLLRDGIVKGPLKEHGIIENRWAMNIADVASCLSPADQGKRVLDAGYVILLNSWGQYGYPHYTRMALESLEILLYRERGNATVVVDRP